jgi:hypothetical protein
VPGLPQERTQEQEVNNMDVTKTFIYQAVKKEVYHKYSTEASFADCFTFSYMNNIEMRFIDLETGSDKYKVTIRAYDITGDKEKRVFQKTKHYKKISSVVAFIKRWAYLFDYS